MTKDFSLESFLNQYDTDISDLHIMDKRFKFFVPKSIEKFVDPDDIFNKFPLWTKIWEASIVLADHLSGLTPEPNKLFLEIGCGLGVVGIVASAFGHKFTVTEYNADAINFCKANSLINSMPSGLSPEIIKLDWNNPTLTGSFDKIVGSEIIYNDRDFEPILNLFRTYLKPGGEIILAEGVRKTSVEFFRQMSAHFNVKGHKKILRSTEKEVGVLLCNMVPK